MFVGLIARITTMKTSCVYIHIRKRCKTREIYVLFGSSVPDGSSLAGGISVPDVVLDDNLVLRS